MPIHDTLRWAFRATTVSVDVHYRPERPRSDVDTTATQAMVKWEVAFLLETIELDLKQRLEGFLKQRSGPTWWTTLPAAVQKKAALRYKWTATDVGRRRLRYPDIMWLSFGDALVVLRELPGADWRACMAAERNRRPLVRSSYQADRQFEATMSAVGKIRRSF